jgi:hypothetical protein
MPEIRIRQNDASPEIEYSEIFIPSDEDLGTGDFTTVLRPNVLPASRRIASTMINPPSFQISVTVNPNGIIAVLIGKVDGSDPLSKKYFNLPPNVDPAISHELIARFEDWQTVDLELNGDLLLVIV